jgi:trimeric autotransporter adhesin
VSANTTVYAQWQEPAQWSAYKYDVPASYGANFYERAMMYISFNAGNYIIVLGSDAVVSNSSSNYRYISNASSVMLVGAGSRRTISLSANGSLLNVYASAKLILDYNITLQGRSSNNKQLVYVDEAQLVMNEGAVITGNTYNDAIWGQGSGVYVESGTFTMNGGTISDNTSGSGGGGVYIRSGTFTMSGGIISGNTSGSSGGGVVSGNGLTVNFTMSGGTISGNTSGSHGGGVYAYGGSGTFTMSGGTISGNTSGSNGGGVLCSNQTFRLITGTIYGNESTVAENLRNTATGSGASLNISGTATYGTSASGGTSGGSLATSNATIKAVNGILQ